MRKLIISLAISGRENYELLQRGLIHSLPVGCDKWILNGYPANVTPHQAVPYRFKYDLIKIARATLGYEQIWWLDSTMRILRDPFELFLSGKGVVAFDNLGHPLYKYISDIAVSNLRCEAELHKIPNSWGGAIGFDFTQPVTDVILAEILHQADMGTFSNAPSVRNGFIAGRHDQSCNSVILYQHGISLLPYGVIAAKADVTQDTYIQYGD